LNIFQLIAKLFSRSPTAEKPITPEMRTALETWLDLYQYQSSTASKNRSLNLPSVISSEFARLVLAESTLQVNGAGYLNEQFQRFFKQFPVKSETAFALGSMAFKPYVSGGKILVDMVRADCFAPTAFDDAGTVTGAVFMARKVTGQRYYTRLETHSFDASAKTYTVENRAYCSYSLESLGTPCALQSVAEWGHLQEVQTIANVEKPLFAVYRNPVANSIDLSSPMGISVYAHAVDLIQEANDQWGRIMWEFKGTELAVDASEDLFRRDPRNGNLLEIPTGNKRLFRKFASTDNKIADDLQVFSPEIRDSSLFNGLNHILQRIEFNTGLAYGTISEPALIEKTAEEIRTSKQRSFEQVSKMQRALQDAFEQLLDAMCVYADLYELSPTNQVSLSCNWGDSVLEDTDKEFNRRFQLMTAGKLKPEKLLSWYFGFDEKDAKTMAEYLPVQTDLFGGVTDADALRI
jgi:A118 family predicted phage portal protein